MCIMTALQYVAVPFSVRYHASIHGTWLFCNVLQCVAVCSVAISHIHMRSMTALQYVAVSCSALQCPAMCGSVWQGMAVYITVKQCVIFVNSHIHTPDMTR